MKPRLIRTIGKWMCYVGDPCGSGFIRVESIGMGETLRGAYLDWRVAAYSRSLLAFVNLFSPRLAAWLLFRRRGKA